MALVITNHFGSWQCTQRIRIPASSFHGPLLEDTYLYARSTLSSFGSFGHDSLQNHECVANPCFCSRCLQLLLQLKSFDASQHLWLLCECVWVCVCVATTGVALVAQRRKVISKTSWNSKIQRNILISIIMASTILSSACWFFLPSWQVNFLSRFCDFVFFMRIHILIFPRIFVGVWLFAWLFMNCSQQKCPWLENGIGTVAPGW